MTGMMHSLILFTGLLLGTIVSAVPIEGDGKVHSSHFLNVIYYEIIVETLLKTMIYPRTVYQKLALAS